ncbi:MAG TPA: mandelate racemase [Hyphomicrobiaceae bacterium]|nr:mandelate racemase [Hyphomicrobiaceae bacterium]
MSAAPSFTVASTMTKLKLEAVSCYERDVTLRLPFRFGVITVTRATQAVIRATIALPDGRTSVGVAAESLAAKWFDKSPIFSDAQNLEQLRQSLALAIGLYRDRGWSTPFGLYSGCYPEQLKRGAELGLLPLVAGYGPALLDRAILDALGRVSGQSFADMIRGNLPGLAVTELTPDLDGFELAGFLAGLSPGCQIAVRHTVGLLDPIVASDQTAAERVGDGLPETLEEVARSYRGRYYKLKVGGDVTADLERLTRIAAVLDREIGDYRATLDGNEQYDDVDGIAELWQRMCQTPALARLVASTLFIEQPIKRGAALTHSVAALARLKPLIIDESDGELSSFPTARRLGYSGVSSKTCKGLYKSILNAARVAKLNAEAGSDRYFLSAEDLTTLAGVSVQQDLALVSLLGLGHVERNGHHFIDGMSFAPAHEQAAFAGAHPDLYDRAGGPARLAIRDGQLRLQSLDCPGFAVAAAMDFGAMRSMPAAPTSRLLPAFAERG